MQLRWVEVEVAVWLRLRWGVVEVSCPCGCGGLRLRYGVEVG